MSTFDNDEDYSAYTGTASADTSSSGSHAHNVTGNTGSEGSHAHNISGSSSQNGVSGAGKNMPPWYALCYIIKT